MKTSRETFVKKVGTKVPVLRLQKKKILYLLPTLPVFLSDRVQLFSVTIRLLTMYNLYISLFSKTVSQFSALAV